MANTMGNYNAEFYARSALVWLKNRLGIAKVINRQFENERNASFEQGDTIKIRRPSTFTAEDHVEGTGSSDQDIKGQNVTISLDKHKEVKFFATDREISRGGVKFINEHLGPAVNALVNKVEEDVYTNIAKIGPISDASGASGVEDYFVDARQVLLDNKCPLDGNWFYAIDTALEAIFLKDPLFHQANFVGDPSQRTALIEGLLNKRFGVNPLVSQLAKRTVAAQTATLAAAAGTGDRVGAVDNAPDGYDVNASSMIVDGLTNTETLSVNVDTFTIAGDPTVYMVTSVSGAVTSGEVTVGFYPPLQKAAADNAVVTFTQRTTAQDAGATTENLMFHKDALALVTAPLPMEGNGRGVEMFVATDPDTGLSVRFRRWYEGDASKNKVAVDILYGTQVLNSQMGVRVSR